MMLPDTLAPLPVAEDARLPKEDSEFVSDAAIRQLLVGPMAVLPAAEGPAVEWDDFAGRVDLGEEMLFSIRRSEESPARAVLQAPHPAFIPAERRAAPPRPRSQRPAEPTRIARGALTTLLLGTAAAAGLALYLGLRPATPPPPLSPPMATPAAEMPAAPPVEEPLLVNSPSLVP